MPYQEHFSYRKEKDGSGFFVAGPVVDTPCEVEVRLKSGETKKEKLRERFWKADDSDFAFYSIRERQEETKRVDKDAIQEIQTTLAEHAEDIRRLANELRALGSNVAQVADGDNVPF